MRSVVDDTNDLDYLPPIGNPQVEIPVRSRKR